MILRRLRLRNFRKYRDCEIDLPEGVTAVVGPNGSGKSTLFEAVAWALYGNGLSRTGGPGLYVPGRTCEVELEFAREESVYRVRRRLTNAGRCSPASLLRGTETVASGSPAVARWLRNMLPRDPQAFLRTSWCRQGELAALARETPIRRSHVLSGLLGLGRVDRVLAAVRADLPVRSAPIADSASLQKEMSTAREEASRLRQELKALDDQMKLDEARKCDYDRLRAAKEVLERSLEETLRNRERLERGLDLSVPPFDLNRLVATRTEIRLCSAHCDRAEQRLRTLHGARDDVCPTCGSRLPTGVVLSQVREELANSRRRLSSLRGDERHLEASLRTSRTREEIARLREEEDRLQARRDDLTFPSWNESEFAERKRLRSVREEALRGAIARAAALAGRLEEARERNSDPVLLRRLEALLREFRRDLLARFLPALEAEASRVLTRGSAGRFERIRLDDDFRVRVVEAGRAHSIYRFSGGEQDLAALSLRIGLTTLCAPEGRPGFLVLDEAFAGQDRDRHRSLLEALRLLTPIIPQIFVSTHCEEMWESLPSVLRIRERTDGRSEIEVVRTVRGA